MRVNKDAVSAVPYLIDPGVDDRVVPLQPLWDGTRWRQWVADANDGLVEIDCRDFLQGLYFARSPESTNSDYHLGFLELLTKRANFPEIQRYLRAIESDLYNLGASLWKLDHMFDTTQGTPSTYLALTELEYCLIVCRSLFDLLQGVIADLWRRIQRTDGVKKKELPADSFSKVVMAGQAPRSAEQIMEKWFLPAPLAHIYEEPAEFFGRLRTARDLIIHRGVTHDPVFRLADGFAVASGEEPFASLTCWPDAALTENGLGSLRFLLAQVIGDTLSACDRLVNGLASLVGLPKDIAPGHSVFVRGFHVSVLLRLPDVRSDPWARFRVQA